MSIVNSNLRGDLFVAFAIKIPESLTEHQIELLNKAKLAIFA